MMAPAYTKKKFHGMGGRARSSYGLRRVSLGRGRGAQRARASGGSNAALLPQAAGRARHAARRLPATGRADAPEQDG
jgi:hypothetical protein